MRIKIKVTDLTAAQWTFVQKFVSIEYPLDGTAVQVTYEYAVGIVEFNTVMGWDKFKEIQGHLAYLGGDTSQPTPFHDPDEQDDFTYALREQQMKDVITKAAEQHRLQEILDLIQKTTDTVNEMRNDLREMSVRSTYPKEMLR